ncbi:MAG: hypothetical protein WA476_18455 [Acidobacteriaceae bacterium]
MNTFPPEPYKGPESARRRQDYAYRFAEAAAALFLLLTWLTA